MTLYKGAEVLLRAKIVELDCNPQGSAIKVEILGSNPDQVDHGWAGNERKTSVTFWIHRLDQPKVIIIEERVMALDKRKKVKRA